MLLIVPTLDHAVDEAARAAVEIVEVVEGGIALLQALQRHRPPRGPAARLQRLLQRPDFVGVGVDEPDEPLGSDGRGLRDRLGGRKHRLEALERALPRRLHRNEGEEAEGDLVFRSSQPCSMRSGIGGGALERLGQHGCGERHRRLDAAEQRDEDLVGKSPKGQPLIVRDAQLGLAATEVHQRRVIRRRDAGRDPAAGLGRQDGRLESGTAGREPVDPDVGGGEVPLEDRWRRGCGVTVLVAVTYRRLKLFLVVDEHDEALPAQAGLLD